MSKCTVIVEWQSAGSVRSIELCTHHQNVSPESKYMHQELVSTVDGLVYTVSAHLCACACLYKYKTFNCNCTCLWMHMGMWYNRQRAEHLFYISVRCLSIPYLKAIKYCLGYFDSKFYTKSTLIKLIICPIVIYLNINTCIKKKANSAYS